MGSFRVYSLVLVVLCGAHVACAGVFSRLSGGRSSPKFAEVGADVGEPLYLSKLLKDEGPLAARSASHVVLPSVGPRLLSYSGYVQTEPNGDTGGKQMFIWYFPPQEATEKNAPLLIWLQGGPGGSSMFGLFGEMGPIMLDADLNPMPNPYTWNKKYGMLFIDNPVGAGFSNTDETRGYCTNTKECVGDNLVQVMVQFYQIFPEVRSSDLYITGESYAGHYIPGFAAKIIEWNEGPRLDKIPLKGVAIGDGWVDPINMIPGYPELMKNLGLATDAEVAVIQDYCDRSVSFIKQGKMTDAFNVWDEMLNGDIYPYPNYFHNITGSNNYDNVDMTNNPPDEGYFPRYLNQPAIRKAIHVGDICFGCNAGICEHHLMADFHVSLRPQLELILKTPGMKVNIYSGQLDIIIASALTERFLPYIEWPGAAAFAVAPKKVWRVEGTDAEVAGFVREIPGFQRVILRTAGHIVPFDQPRRSLDMIIRFVEDIPYENQIDPVKPDSSFVV